MKVWVARRREEGALLDTPIQFGEASAPFELLVVEVTDQGRRRPTRVARLVPPGQRVTVADLLAPRMVWMSGWRFVLSGIEEFPEREGLAGAAQSWVCELAVPPRAVGFLARNMYKHGVELRSGVMMDRYGTKHKGALQVECAYCDALGRNAVRAIIPSEGSPFAPPALLDVELLWMAEERFALTGLEMREVGASRPARLVRQGWLCEYDLAELPEPPRKPKSVR